MWAMWNGNGDMEAAQGLCHDVGATWSQGCSASAMRSGYGGTQPLGYDWRWRAVLEERQCCVCSKAGSGYVGCLIRWGGGLHSCAAVVCIWCIEALLEGLSWGGRTTTKMVVAGKG